MGLKIIKSDEYRNVIDVPIEGIRDYEEKEDKNLEIYQNLYSDIRFRSLLIPEKSLQKRIQHLAKLIVKNHENKSRFDFLIVLTGAFIFGADLSRKIYKISGIDVFIHSVKLSTYQDEVKRKGEINRQVRFELEPLDIEKRDIIIIEDIIDQGFTLNALMDYLVKKKKVNSVKICSLLLKKLDNPSQEVKQSRKNIENHVDFIGFTVPDIWVAGYGIDASNDF
ncbi:MAG: phosphoribosyltransferase family protein, partial [Promethearchaeota archaeon]